MKEGIRVRFNEERVRPEGYGNGVRENEEERETVDKWEERVQ